MTGLASRYPGGAAWSVEEIPYDALERDRVADDARLFHVLAAASFLEITSDTYTRNLIEFFAGDDEIVAWLRDGWEPEEIQHGVALKRYVEAAWPDFDWRATYRDFYREFVQFCSVDQLAATPALEMAARCVVETGTASFYRTLADLAAEPVLRQLASHISSDEVRHYKHFYAYFLRYQEREQAGRAAIARTLLSRMGEVNAEDAFFAYKHVFLAMHPGATFRKADFKAFRDDFRRMAKQHFPYEMATKMILKPLGLNATLGRAVTPALAGATRRIF